MSRFSMAVDEDVYYSYERLDGARANNDTAVDENPRTQRHNYAPEQG